MQEKYTGNAVIERGYAIYDEWNKNKYKSRKIVNSVQKAVASTNAKKNASSRVEALAYLFALDLRIKERYGNLLMCILFYFSWRRESDAFKRFKGMMKMSAGRDIRTLIEVELEKLRENIDEDESEGSDRKGRGGKVNEFSGEEAVNSEGEQKSDEVDEEKLEENREKEKETDKTEDVGADGPIEEQSRENKQETAIERREAEVKPQERNESAVLEEKAEIKQEYLNEQKNENNGSDEKLEPIADKKQETVNFNGAIDVPYVFYDEKSDEDNKEISFIDEVIMDNMIKGKSDIIGHNPLEDVKQEVLDKQSATLDASAIEKGNDSDKDAYLYDKMVLNMKGEAVQNTPNVLQNNEKTVENVPQENSQSDIREKILVVVNQNPKDEKAQVNVKENISEENVLRRGVNDKFTDEMVIFHKSLMEDALREIFKISDDEMGGEGPVNVMEGSNFEECQAKIAAIRKH